MKRFKITLSVLYKLRNGKGRFEKEQKFVTFEAYGLNAYDSFDKEIDASVLAQAPAGVVSRGVEVLSVEEVQQCQIR